MQAEKKENSSYFSRVEKIKVSRGWTWDETAERLHLTRGMLHFIKHGKYGVSKRNLYMLEQLEREEGVRIPSAKELIQGIIRTVEESKIAVTPADFDRGYIDVPVKYARGEPPSGCPRKIRLTRPDTRSAAKLIVALGIHEEPESVLFACIADEKYKTQEFINLLSPFSFQALMDVALPLAFGVNWQAIIGKSAPKS